MADAAKERRTELLDKAVSAAAACVSELEDLSNSGNPDTAADALASLLDARNARDDLAAILALVGNKPADALKPVSDADLDLLATLENAIDARVRNNQLIAGGVTAAAQTIRIAQSIGQILQEA